MLIRRTLIGAFQPARIFPTCPAYVGALTVTCGIWEGPSSRSNIESARGATW